MATSKKPTGLQIDRKGNKYIFSWNKADSYGDGQQLQWSYKASKTHKSSIVKLGKSVKKYTVTSPSKLSEISFKVRGNHDQNRKDPGWSDWASKSFDVDAPKAPKIDAAWSSSTPDKTTFTYTATDDDHMPFDHVEYRTKWIKDYNGKPKSYTWSGSVSTSSSKTGTIFNSTETVPSGQSYTRVVQCRAVGPGGASAWVFKAHVYAKPNIPVIISTEGTVQNTSRNKITLNLKWKTSATSDRPIDNIGIEYLITAPGADMSVPAGASWQQADTPAKKGATSWSEEISGILDDDQVLFARIHVTHDTRDDWSTPVVALRGSLAAPTNVSITPDQELSTITVTATNASSVPDSFLAVRYRDGDSEAIYGIIPHGSSTVTMKVPSWSGTYHSSVGVFAVVGTYNSWPQYGGIVTYTLPNPQMTSGITWEGVMIAPTINVVQSEIEETAIVSWNRADYRASGTEISWSDHADAWNSTDEPETHLVTNNRANQLSVSGLEPGILWYFKARHILDDGNDTTYGLYSDVFSLNLSSAPAIPVLEMSDSVIDPDGESIASWVYISGDNTPQIHATIATYSAGTYTEILQVETEQTAVIRPSDLEWAVGDYQLAVKVESASGRWSEYSDPVPVSVREPLTCSITQPSLVSRTETIDGTTYTYPYVLAKMPMTVTVTGAGTAGQTVLTLKRKADYVIMKPDETELVGHADEVICQHVYTGEAQQTIFIDEVMGKLNDGATYYIKATVTDDLGREAHDRYPNDDPDDYFKVIWDEQAIMPEATAEIIDDEYAKLSITKPQDWAEGDVVDIYRMTSDRPQLIAEDIAMDDDPVEYVDPFPTLGEYGGYRFVYKTANGDSTLDADDNFAWLDVPAVCESQEAIVDFNGERIHLPYNLKVSNTWGKEFQETRYLGGHITGDWMAGVSRTGSIDTVTVPLQDPALFRSIRRLAEYIEPCHVRTLDGSVLVCNVDVDDDFGYDTAGKIQSVKLDFTRVDPVDLDAVPLADWLVTP